jgi:hypothetical protein
MVLRLMSMSILTEREQGNTDANRADVRPDVIICYSAVLVILQVIEQWSRRSEVPKRRWAPVVKSIGMTTYRNAVVFLFLVII